MHSRRSLPLRSTRFLIFVSCFILPLAAHAAPSFATLYNFGVSAQDGDGSYATLVINSAGVLFGTTIGGGTNGQGTAFSLTPPATAGAAWTETILWNFGGVGDGQSPAAGLVLGRHGILYGTTESGGLFDQGVVFSLTPPSAPGGAWTETVLYNFSGGIDGGVPQSALVIGKGGVLYGTTTSGGSAFAGTVFALTPPAAPAITWTEAVLYSFTDADGDGAAPVAGVVLHNGDLYGTTNSGGQSGLGTVFSLTPPTTPGNPWTEAVIYSFQGGADGEHPQASVVVGARGIVYGTTVHGGADNLGCVFQLTPPASAGANWTEAILYNFQAAAGELPRGSLLLSKKTGALYGTTTVGGAAPRGGTLFALRRTSAGSGWTQTVLHNFSGADGSQPSAGLVAQSGVLYGATRSGGTNNWGTIFSLTL